MARKIPTPKPEIFHGLVGEIVDVFSPFTEAAGIAIAAQTLIAFGNAVGPGPGIDVGETRHHLNENLLLVGTSSRARKGDSVNIALRTLRDADPEWAANIGSGLSSGEGLIHAVRDPVMRTNREGIEECVDPGVEDKRLLVVETEFSTALKQFSRQGNTLSNVIRDAWDSKPTLRTMTKNSPVRATGAHISIIAHTTPEDLHAHLTDVDIANGLGNRFVIVLTHRERRLPSPGKAPESAVRALAKEVRKSLEVASQATDLRRSPEAARVWEEIYEELTTDQPGLTGQLLARSEAHVLRLSTLYALIARAHVIDIEHQEAALALWDYAEASVRRIFGLRTGRPGADRILSEMVPGETLNQTAIRQEIFSNHVSAVALGDDLKLLAEIGAIRIDRKKTGGRPEILVTRIDGESQEPKCAGVKSSLSAESLPSETQPAGGLV